MVPAVQVEKDIAVIVPAFERVRRLERALDSVFGQTLPAREIVVVDDGSTRDLSAVQEKIEGRGGRWIRHSRNRGPAAARNTGVAATDSRWIAFLDSDDWWEPEKLRRQLASHEQHPGLRISQVSEEWRRGGETVAKPDHWEPGEGDLFAESVARCSIAPSCVMMERSLLDEHGGFDPRFRVCEDYELWLRITARERIGKVPGPPLVIREGGSPDQLSIRTPAMDRQRVVALIERLRDSSLTADEESLVRQGIRAKAGIVASGARKRGLPERAEIYERIAAVDWASISTDRLDAVLASAWSEIEASSGTDCDP